MKAICFPSFKDPLEWKKVPQEEYLKLAKQLRDMMKIDEEDFEADPLVVMVPEEVPGELCRLVFQPSLNRLGQVAYTKKYRFQGSHSEEMSSIPAPTPEITIPFSRRKISQLGLRGP